MGELRALAIEAFAASPRHGVEIVGILLGDVRESNVRIGGFEQVPIEHSYGPSYSLSEKDWNTLSGLAAARQGRAPRLIGFFRSFAGREPVVEDADAAFVRRHFPRGDFIFLALQPLSATTCVAGFRFFQNGVLLPRSEDPPFVLEPAPADREEEEKILWPPRPSAPPPKQEAEPRSLAPKPAPARREKRARWWVLLLVAAVSAVIAAAIADLWSQARAPHWAELHLDALPHSGSLEISWDTGAARRLGATVGLLRVTDAGQRHDIALMEDQVRAGTYEYTPASGDDDVRLILYTGGKGVAGDAVRLASSALLAPKVPSIGEAEHAAPVDAPIPPQSPRASAPAPGLPAAPPWPVHETEPQIPDGIRSRLQTPVTIAIGIDVSAQGRVLHAGSEAYGHDDVQSYLAMLAEKAALEWRFRPARARDGGNVAASTTVRFVFYPWSPSASASTGR